MEMYKYSLIIATIGLVCVSVVDSHWTSSIYAPWCYVSECCNKKWILKDFEALLTSLNEELFGQHLVHKTVYGSMRGHAVSQPTKPLVLSFHGSTGTGKTYVSQWIAKSWFKKGLKSKYVHFLIGTKEFPHKSELHYYKDKLRKMIVQETKKCPHQLFIFDEIDSFPPGLLDSIRPYLEYYEDVDGVDYRNTIFVFLSNTGTSSLRHITEDYFQQNIRREDIMLAETERAMIKEIFNAEGEGLSKSRLIDSHLISHYVPFLPLEKRHVKMCIRNELKKNFKKYNTDGMADEVIEELQFVGPKMTFSVKGCKNVAEKVRLRVSYRDFQERKTEL